MRDKRPAIAAKHKSGFPPHKGGLQAEGRFDFVFLEVTTYGWLRESYNPVKNAMCKRWDTPRKSSRCWLAACRLALPTSGANSCNVKQGLSCASRSSRNQTTVRWRLLGVSGSHWVENVAVR